MLHDLTNCLHIADVSEFADEDNIVLYEVKKKKARMEKVQMRRIEEAMHAVMSNGPLPGIGSCVRLVAVDHPYITDLDKLSAAIRLAHRHGGVGKDAGRWGTATRVRR